MLSRTILAALALLLAANLYFTDRPWTLTSAPRVAEIAVLPDGPALAALRRDTEIGMGMLPYPNRRTPPAAGPMPLKLGWAYREVALFGMPMWGYPEGGLVTYLEMPQGIQVALIDPERAALLDRLTGERYASLSFPWHRFVWGWLAVAALLAWVRIGRWEARREEERAYAEPPLARNAKRWSLPVAVLGSASTNSISRGYL